MKKSIQLIDQIKSRLSYLDEISNGQRLLIEKNLQEILEIIPEIAELKSDEQAMSGSRFTIWSDGACFGNPGPGGWGTIIRSVNNEVELSGYSPKTTNNIMEMTGALEGLERCPEGSSITLYSDSKYVVQGMSSWIHGWKKRNWKKADGNPVLNKELWQKLDKAASKRSIEWKWVKGHAGHEENERCDELAKQAIRDNS